jgi:DNA-binding NarL/FixJ family response regulator
VYAGVLIALGNWPTADEELTGALAGYDELGSPGRVFALARLAQLRVHQGRLDEAGRLLEGYEDHPLTVPASVALALAQGRHELACALVTRRLEASDEAALAALLPLCVEARLAAGDRDGAAEAAQRMRDLGARLGRSNLTAYGDFAAARVASDPADAQRLLGAAADAFSRLEMPLEHGRARLELARSESDANPELALVHARGALITFERLGARREADAAAALLRSLGASGRSAPRIDGELTSREREVLELLREGLSNRTIADRLFISPKTAEHHVGRVLGKLGLRSRAEAAAYAVRGGRGSG